MEISTRIPLAGNVSLGNPMSERSDKSEQSKDTNPIERIEEVESLLQEYQGLLISVLDSLIKRCKFEALAHS